LYLCNFPKLFGPFFSTLFGAVSVRAISGLRLEGRAEQRSNATKALSPHSASWLGMAGRLEGRSVEWQNGTLFSIE
jgi:hypothetical protein